MFEILKSDLRGRLGILHTNHGKVETPAFVPVIHPVKQSVPSSTLSSMGFEMVITNAYIAMKRHGEDAVRRGIHDVIGFEGAVMTDSGGYQVLEYGDISVSPTDMAEFETRIKSDVAVPLDKPTGFGLPLRTAENLIRHTLRVSKETLDGAEENGQLWVGPIQGGEHLELVRRSTNSLVGAGFEMMALGSPVEFMESYRYGLLARMIKTAKLHMPHGIPLHLFGAGHPLTVGLAVALGCDTFDSASYMLYARQGRYITEDGTRRIADIGVFPCICRICQRHTPAELAGMDQQERTGKIAVHNLYMIKNEVDKVRQAILEGRLWEYVVKKARAHPRLFEVLEVLAETDDFFEASTPVFKERAIFLYDRIDQFRPEVRRYHTMVKSFRSAKQKLIIMPESVARPAYLSGEYKKLASTFGEGLREFQVCQYSPHLGIIPVEISDVFPAAHHETAITGFEPRDYEIFADVLYAFLGNNKFTEIHYDMDDAFLAYFMRNVPPGTRQVQVKK